MKIRLSTFLICTLCGITLAGCDWLGMKNPFADDQRDPQVVQGSRHSPILNPDTVPPNPEMRGYVHGTVPPQIQPIREGISPENYDNNKVLNSNGPTANTMNSNTSPAAVRSANANPYDAYDASGNPVAPPSQGNVFGHTFGASSDGAVRKSLSDNPYYSQDNAAPVVPLIQPQALAKPPAPAPQTTPMAPASKAASVPPVPEAAKEQLSDEMAEEEKESPDENPETVENAAKTQPANAAAQPSLFDRWFGKYEGNEQDPARNAPTPLLSTVPQTPEQFQTIKDEKLGNMQDLQGDRIEAVQEKEELDNEPSQLPQPEPQPQLQPLLGVPAGANTPLTIIPPTSTPTSATAPVLLGRVGASPMFNTPVATSPGAMPEPIENDGILSPPDATTPPSVVVLPAAPSPVPSWAVKPWLPPSPDSATGSAPTPPAQ